MGSLKYDFRHTLINHFLLTFPKSPITARRHVDKNPLLTQCRQNIELCSLSFGWPATGVHHSARKWTTDGPPVADLTIFCLIKYKTATFGK